MEEKIGRIAFIVGLVISVVAGVVNWGPWALPGLAVLGVLVGLLNVTGKEVEKFLASSVALIIAGIAGLTAIGSAGTALTLGFVDAQSILAHFIAFIAGATFIVALKEVFDITKSK